MVDLEPAPGWWLASDGRWYPPELHPDIRAAVASPPAPTDGVHLQNGRARLDDPFDVLGPAPTEFWPAHLRETPAPVAPAPSRPETPRPARPAPPRWHRRLFGIGGAMVAIGAAIYLTTGRGGRPALTTAPRVVATGPAPSAGGPPASTAPGPSSAPSTTAAGATTAPATGAPTTTTASGATTVTGAPTTTAASGARVVSVFDLAKSDCIDNPDLADGLVSTIRVVACAQRHSHEVFFTGRYPVNTFDAQKISDYANDTCLQQFESYVGISYDRSRYQYLHITPTQDSWIRDDDRDIVCLAFEPKTTLTGSIAGAKQ